MEYLTLELKIVIWAWYPSRTSTSSISEAKKKINNLLSHVHPDILFLPEIFYQQHMIYNHFDEDQKYYAITSKKSSSNERPAGCLFVSKRNASNVVCHAGCLIRKSILIEPPKQLAYQFYSDSEIEATTNLVQKEKKRKDNLTLSERVCIVQIPIERRDALFVCVNLAFKEEEKIKRQFIEDLFTLFEKEEKAVILAGNFGYDIRSNDLKTPEFMKILYPLEFS